MDLMQLMSSRIGLMLDSVGTGMKVSSNKQFIPLCIIYVGFNLYDEKVLCK